MINNGIHFVSVFDFGIVPTLWYFILLFHLTQEVVTFCEKDFPCSAKAIRKEHKISRYISSYFIK